MPFDVLPAVTSVPAVFINTENLASLRNLVEFNAYAASARVGSIYDHSRKNVELSGDRATFLPLRQPEADTLRLQALMRKAETTTGRSEKIACIGTATSHRVAIVNGLRLKGISVDLIEAFGEERDARASRCSLLLNLHAGKDFKPWEALRCNRWRHAGMLVVSEPCDVDVPALQDATGARNAVVFVSADDIDALATALSGLLGTPPSTAGTAAAGAGVGVAAAAGPGLGTRPSGGAGGPKKPRRQGRRK